MPCYNPLTAWVNIHGGKPLFKYDPESAGSEMQLACGQCIGCRLEHSRQWAMRCVHESQMHDENSFITLTYSDEHLPLNGSLDHSHFQKFLKRYRKLIAPRKIKYFMCGEYGEDTGRPHFHTLIFGHEFTDQKYWRTSAQGHRLTRSKTLEKLWPFGHSEIGDLSFESAAYTARYCLKKVTGEDALDHYSSCDSATGEWILRQPEYSRMSTGRGRNQGIGASWYKKYKNDLRKGYIHMRGRKMAPPKYYRLLADRMDPDEHDRQREVRQERVRIADQSDNTNYRLRTREHCAKRRQARIKRGD